MTALDDARTRILSATMQAVRKYGLEGVRIQNISELSGLSPGALYRYFDSKEQMIVESFTCIDKQAAEIFEHIEFDPQALISSPMEAVKNLWLPYFRFWTSHPDETVFYHRFRDSMFFPAYDGSRDTSYFRAFSQMARTFMYTFPSLHRLNRNLLWIHVLTTTVLYAKYVVEGVLPNNEETEETVFRLLSTGLSSYLMPDKHKN